MERKYTFDKIASEYDRIRPKYPKQVFQDIINYSDIKKDERILEIGCGTGQATTGFVNLGYTNITGIELGIELSKIASENFIEHEGIKIYNSSFEEWEDKGDKYNLIISATAFHWVKQDVGYKKVGNLLKDNGSIGFFWTHHVPGHGNIYSEITECYKEYAPHLDFNDSNQVEEIIQERTKATQETGLFKELVVKRYEWIDKYSADDFIALFNTNSAHQVLEQDIKENLFNGIGEIIKKHGNEILKPQFVVLYLARKK